MTSQPHTVGILIFDDVEVLDAFGPFEVFSIAQTTSPDDSGGKLFQVVTIAETTDLVRTRGGLVVKPHHDITNHPGLDILLVPGGKGVHAARRNPALLSWLKEQVGRTTIRTSVCTGALMYGEIGLLDGHNATTHWGALDLMKNDYPEITVQSNVRYVDEGDIVTSAGVSAGIDMALHIVARLHGEETAQNTARQMEYELNPA